MSPVGMNAEGFPNRGVAVTVEESDPGMLAGIAERMILPEFGVETVHAFEAEEEKVFASYGGKYVRSGALEASLTQSDAPGAVRILTPGSFTFGTSIWYAIFQGTTGKGRHRPPSAILKATALEAAAAASDLGSYIMYGRRAGTAVMEGW